MHSPVHTLTQAPIFNPDTTDPVEHYELIHREERGGENTSQIVLPEATPTTFVDVTITGLQKGTSYVLFVIAYNSRGPGRTFTSVVVQTIVDRKKSSILKAVDSYSVQDSKAQLWNKYKHLPPVSSPITNTHTCTDRKSVV